MQVNIVEAKNRLSELIRTALAGEDVIIANRGRPVARIVPVEATSPHAVRQGSAEAILEHLKRYPMPRHSRRSTEEIDAEIQEERSAWD